MDFAGFSGGGHAEVDREKFAMVAAEAQRYASFFATLEQVAPNVISRATATAFFAKSSLSDTEVDNLYASVKAVGVLTDPQVMNETEFIMGMHLIMCLAKRGLDKLPSPFPTHLFPTLSLPSAASASAFGFSSLAAPSHADLISGMPSPDKPVDLSGGSTVAAPAAIRSSFTAAGDAPVTSTPPGEIVKLKDATSLVELAQKEVQNHQVITSHLAQIDQAESKALQHLQRTLEELGSALQQRGFPVPPTSYTSIGALDDLGTFLRANIQSLKQEIQSLEIAARMRSVADEATSRTNSRSSNASAVTIEPMSRIAEVSRLTAQLAVLQQEAGQLRDKKDALALQLLGRKKAATTSVSLVSEPIKAVSGPTFSPSATLPQPPLSSSSTSSIGPTGSSSWGAFGAPPAAVAPLAPPQETLRLSESTHAPSTSFGNSSSNDFGFAAFDAPATSATTAQQPQDDAVGWGAFQ